MKDSWFHPDRIGTYKREITPTLIVILVSGFLFLVLGGVSGAKEVVLNCKYNSYRMYGETKNVENINMVTILNLQKKTLHHSSSIPNAKPDYLKLIVENDFYRAFDVSDPKVNYATNPISRIKLITINRYDGSYKIREISVPLKIGKDFILEEQKTSNKLIFFEKLADYVGNHNLKNFNNTNLSNTSFSAEGICSQPKEKL